jgi:glycosyltransferase involved in cell wall biosynthesis
VALLICSRVLGGHEQQALSFARDLAQQADVTVFVNQEVQRALFSTACVSLCLLEDQLLTPGVLPLYFWQGWRRRHAVRRAVQGFAHAIVCAGAIEAGIAVGVGLVGRVPMSLYLPMFYDRRPMWGAVLGGFYNWLLGLSCKLFDRIITINRIQSHLIRAHTGCHTLVLPNVVRPVAAPVLQRPGKLVFIGRLGAQKRVDELLQWIDFPANPFREILVIGDGPQRDVVAAVASRMVHVRADLRGWLSEAEQDALLSVNDVLLLNSLIEGEPLVIREANLRGMRVVCRAIDGVRGMSQKAYRYSTAQALQSILSGLSTLAPAGPSWSGRAGQQVPAARRACIEKLLLQIRPVPKGAQEESR